jgi:hypothetical protein
LKQEGNSFMTPAEAMREAKKLIEAGWSPVGVQNADGRAVPLHISDGERAKINPDAVKLTAYGAIAVVMRRERVERPALVFDVLYRLAADAMPGHAHGGTNYVHPLLAFNSAEGRTQAEVADLFERAAVQCEEIGDGVFPCPIPTPAEASMRGPG